MSIRWLPIVVVPALLALAPPAPAFRLAPESVAQRVAVSDVVVVGKVTKIEDKKVKLGPLMAEHQIAVVKVEQPIRGAEGLTHVRVAFAPGRRTLPLAVDQEALLFLQQVKGETVYTVPPFSSYVDKKGGTLEKDAKAAAYAKLLAKPEDGLKSKDAKDRYLTASMLLLRYRTPGYGDTKQEPIDAAQSKLILETVAAADWNANTPELAGLDPSRLWGLLGVTAKDGWTPPKSPADFRAEAQKWLKDNAGTYRVKKFVADK